MSSRKHQETEIGADVGTVPARALWRELKTLEKAISRSNDAVLEYYLGTGDQETVDAIAAIAERYNDLRLSFFSLLQPHSPEPIAMQRRLDPKLLRERIQQKDNESICAEIQSIDKVLHTLLMKIGALTPASPSPNPPEIS